MSSTITAKTYSKCPLSNPEFELIRANHANLASTGCEKDFCQAGRAIHTDEPRVGQNRALCVVEREARDFLSDIYREGFYIDDGTFSERLGQALLEIRNSATERDENGRNSKATIGGNWIQTRQELEFGVRRAWRNSRKCIMRSHCEELQLCDLRTINSSEQMAIRLIEGIQKAFNQGNIQPTVFVFAPRAVNRRGPMILNHQVLQFAGYKTNDGSVIGDPMTVELTNAIIDLGWKPPKPRGRWDVLPLVTMADGDKPFVAELPPDIRKLVDIGHPQYATEFERLNLKWTAFPALTRLGFDIGGVQYTAAPFIGWFMDAEIGIRDLADTFRYNVLPDIVDALGMIRGRLTEEGEDFEDLPEYEKLAMLSRAQTELNYAVQWSFLQAKVTMTDSMTASKKWCQYDDDFRQKNGFRLPADPYWLAPPQGSIIPLWHRGGAPNYQPKPMICKHVQDPVKAWGREKQQWHPNPETSELQNASIGKNHSIISSHIVPQAATPKDLITELYPVTRAARDTVIERTIRPQAPARKSVQIYFCSSGTVAEKLAKKLLQWMKALTKKSSTTSLKLCVEPLNRLRECDLASDNVILMVVSSTGQGEVPTNGSGFVQSFKGLTLGSSTLPERKFNFAVFGNGDSRYSNTFNGAAVKICDLMKQLGGRPLAGGLSNADTAIDPFPLRALRTWSSKLEQSNTEVAVQWIQKPGVVSITKNEYAQAVTVSVAPVEEVVEQYDDYQQELLSTLKDGVLVARSPEAQGARHGSVLLDLQISGDEVKEMSCIQILPVNSAAKVKRALMALRVQESATIDLGNHGENPSYAHFLTHYVDLELPFSKLEWLDSIDIATLEQLGRDALRKMSVIEVLDCLNAQFFSRKDHKLTCQRTICLDMPLLRTRTYSLASSPTYVSTLKKSIGLNRTMSKTAIMVKNIPRGRFSSTFIDDSPLPAKFKYRIVDSKCGPLLRSKYLEPLVIVATGAGFGPVRALLQWRIAAAVAAGQTVHPLKRGVTLLLGIKECDLRLTLEVLNEALALDLIDVLDIVISNPEKRRVYDTIPFYARLIRHKVVKRNGLIFACTNTMAAEATKRAFEETLGSVAMKELGDRYVEEVF